MKLTAISASPRKTGNSATMVDEFCKASGADAIDRYNLADLNISGCRACGACASECSCVIDDDMQKIYQSMSNSDVIVLGSPLYWWSISAQLKAVIDRLYIYIGKGVLDGKKLIVLVSGFSEVPNAGYDLIDGMFKEVAPYLNMEYRGLFVSADDSRHVRNNEAALEQVRRLAAEL